METSQRFKIPLLGRKKEICNFLKYLNKIKDTKGVTLSLTGDAGIGKSRLVEKFKHIAEEEGIEVLKGAADKQSSDPFHLFIQALKDEVVVPFVRLEKTTSFAEIFAVNDGGMLLATALPEDEEEIDGDILAGMLSAVQNFVKDSFGGSSSSEEGLGRLEYGDMKILIEHGEGIYVAAVIKGEEHPDMKRSLKRTVRDIEREDSALVEEWSGGMDEMESIQRKISLLSKTKYLVRRELDDVKLENERIKIADRILKIFSDKDDPVVIILEDLHWSDESSLFVLDYLSRSIHDKKILILCTRRPQESTLADNVIEMLQKDGFLTDTVLQKLRPEIVGSLVDELFSPNKFPESLVYRLSDECRGNPFFIIEMLKQMENEGAIGYIDGHYKLLVEDFTIPSSLEDVVYKRLELLDPDSLSLIEYMSCEGVEIDIDIPESLNRQPEIERPIGSLIKSGILLPSKDYLSFSHAIFRDVIYESLSRWWKNSYHHRLGEFYERKYLGCISDVYYDLARHFSNTIDHTKAHDYSFKAGEKAENALAPERAIGFYRRSLEALDNLSDMDGKVIRRCDILERMGDMKALLGDFEDAVVEYNKVLEDVKDKTTKAVLHRKLGNVFMHTSDYELSLRECNSALEILDQTDPEAAKVKRVKGRTYMRTGDYDVSLDLLNQALEIAKNNSDEKEMSEIAHNQGTVQWYRGEYEGALERLEFSLSVREKLDDTRGIARSFTNIGLVYYSKGDKIKALENYEKALVSFKKIGDKLNIATVINNMGMAYFYLGELDYAVGCFEECLDMFKMIGDKGSVASSLSNLGLAMDDLGDPAKALEYHLDSLQIKKEIGDKNGMATSLYNIGKVYVDAGRLVKAIEHLTSALDLSNEIDDLFLSTEIRLDLTHAYIKMGEIDTSLQTAMDALEISLDIRSSSLEGESRRMLGKVYFKMNMFDKATKEFDKAKMIFEKIGEKVELSYVLVDYGILFDKMGKDKKASYYLKKALEIQKDLNLDNDVSETQNILEKIGTS